MNMIHIKNFVIECANDFIRGLSQHRNKHCFHKLFHTFSVTSLVEYWNFSVLCTCAVVALSWQMSCCYHYS